MFKFCCLHDGKDGMTRRLDQKTWLLRNWRRTTVPLAYETAGGNWQLGRLQKRNYGDQRQHLITGKSTASERFRLADENKVFDGSLVIFIHVVEDFQEKWIVTRQI